MKVSLGDMSDSALRGCVKSLVHSLNGCGDLRDFDDLMELPETVATIEQCKRRFPNWWNTGAGMPAEFKPLLARDAAHWKSIVDAAKISMD